MQSGETGSDRRAAEARRPTSTAPASGSSWAMSQLLRRFIAARQGAVAVELGLIGLPFFMLITGIIVLGFMSFLSSSLDYATQKGVRQLMIGTATNANQSADQFRTSVICPALPAAAFDCSKVVVDLVTVPTLQDQHGDPNAFNSFLNGSQSGLKIPSLSNSQATFCTGAANTYSVLEVMYPLPVYWSALTSVPQVVNGQYVLMSSVAFKNEPFSGTNTTTGC